MGIICVHRWEIWICSSPHWHLRTKNFIFQLCDFSKSEMHRISQLVQLNFYFSESHLLLIILLHNLDDAPTSYVVSCRSASQCDVNFLVLFCFIFIYVCFGFWIFIFIYLGFCIVELMVPRTHGLFTTHTNKSRIYIDWAHTFFSSRQLNLYHQVPMIRYCVSKYIDFLTCNIQYNNKNNNNILPSTFFYLFYTSLFPYEPLPFTQ